MNRLFLLVLFFLIAKAGFAQQKDTLISNLPMVNGRLVYADSIKIESHNRSTLDSAAKSWFAGYFKYHQPDTLSKDKDINSTILSQGLLEFRIATSSLALIKYNFYLIITIKVDCKDNYYTYKIFDIYFRPKSDFFYKVGYYQSSPDYLIGLYSKKHLGLVAGMNLGRKKIREYLKCTNDAVLACIASLNKAMAN